MLEDQEHIERWENEGGSVRELLNIKDLYDLDFDFTWHWHEEPVGELRKLSSRIDTTCTMERANRAFRPGPIHFDHLHVFVPLVSLDGVVQPEYGECMTCGQCERRERRDPPHYGYSTDASVSS